MLCFCFSRVGLCFMTRLLFSRRDRAEPEGPSLGRRLVARLPGGVLPPLPRGAALHVLPQKNAQRGELSVSEKNTFY